MKMHVLFMEMSFTDKQLSRIKSEIEDRVSTHAKFRERRISEQKRPPK
jgi:hypothetical protein